MQLIDSKSKGAKYLSYWFQNPSKILTTILIGNNVANILATALTTVIAEKLFEHNAVAIAVGTMTFLVLTFSEILPKIFARANATKLSLLFIRFLMLFYYLFYPLSFLLVFFTERVFKSAGLQYSRRGPLITLKDLDFFISLAEKEGALKGTRGMYLKAVSEFSALMKTIKVKTYTRYPVINKNGSFVGILHAKDFLLNLEDCKEKNSIISILRPVLWINEFMKIDSALEIMKKNKTHLSLVKDEFDDFSGIITMEDILEELVGDIVDEHDAEEIALAKRPSDKVIVNGEESIHDINEQFNMNIPEDKNYQTLNGFLLDLFEGVLPKENTILIWNDFKIKIVKISDKNVKKVEIILK
jgi:CBS domain containing-hemolysin-like protein